MLHISVVLVTDGIMACSLSLPFMNDDLSFHEQKRLYRYQASGCQPNICPPGARAKMPGNLCACPYFYKIIETRTTMVYYSGVRNSG
jgi:hypothetical protein